MTMPFYVSPEQVLADKAKFARNNIAKGRALLAMQFAGGILIAADNPSNTLRKINEIYDRIAFGGVGKFNEYDQLRQGGVRWADVEGYRYSREDVHAKSLANLYAQILGQTFTHDMKPMEVELLVVEAGFAPQDDEIYHVTFDGLVVDEDRWCVLPTDAEAIDTRLKDSYQDDLPLADAFKVAVQALGGPERSLAPPDLEGAVLERDARRRAFRRLDREEMATLLA
ncbi:MAG TPA: proteasome subunit alpha [Acidimicrobiales bacterium]|nr:proteasome subunit alpha [Acidimicrobiales bacterium]